MTNITIDNATSHSQESDVSTFALIYHIYKTSGDLWFFVVYGIEGAMGILLNCLVIVVFAQKKLRKTAHNVYLINLSIAELLLSLGAVLRVADAFQRISWSQFTCLPFYMVFYTASFCQVQSHILVALERFIAIKWPSRFLQFTNKRLVLRQIVSLWFMSALESILLVYGVQMDFVLTGRCVASFGSSALPITRLYIAVMYLCTPCLITCSIYCYVLKKIWDRRRVNTESLSSDSQRVAKQQRTRAVWIFFITYVLFVLSYFPVSLVSVAQARMVSSVNAMSLINISRFAYLMAYAPLIINPFVHIFVNKDFHSGWKNMLCTRLNHIGALQ